MNWDQLAGNWKQSKGQLKETWGKLTDQDFDAIDGKKDKLIGIIQNKYGLAKEAVEGQLDQLLKKFNASAPKASAKTEKIY